MMDIHKFIDTHVTEEAQKRLRAKDKLKACCPEGHPIERHPEIVNSLFAMNAQATSEKLLEEQQTILTKISEASNIMAQAVGKVCWTAKASAIAAIVSAIAALISIAFGVCTFIYFGKT